MVSPAVLGTLGKGLSHLQFATGQPFFVVFYWHEMKLTKEL